MKQFFSEITRKKHLHLIAEATKDNSMHRTLTATSLTAMGIGAVVGAGIFVITGQAAAVAAGPALAISFVLSAISCFFSGICYAELSAAIPLSGSAYTFTYVAVGEFAAWAVAVCLTLEYLLATSAVSVGWSGSVQSFLAEFDILFPESLSKAPIEIEKNGSLGFSGSYVNLPAVIINVVITVVLCMGVKESATFNNIFVAIKLAVLGIFIAYGVYYANSHGDAFRENMTPYIPPNTGTFGEYGLSGIFRGAGMVFFSYVGFDAVCAMAQECKNPERDLPRGLLLTLVACTVLYIIVTTCLTGMVKYTLLNVDDPVPHALRLVGAPAYIRYAVDIGAISGLTSVCLVSLMCMPRLVYTLSHDGLLPKFLGKIHETFRTPLIATIICGTFATLVGGLLPLDVLGELVSAGTLVAFMLVCYSVIAFRRRHPEYPRPFRVPFVPYFPAAGLVLCLVQMTSLPVRTLLYYALLQFCTFIFYVFYGKNNSIVKRKADERREARSRGVSRTPSRIGTPQSARHPAKGSPAKGFVRTPAIRSPADRGPGMGPGKSTSWFDLARAAEEQNAAHSDDGGDNPDDDYTDSERSSEAEAEAVAYGVEGIPSSTLHLKAPPSSAHHHAKSPASMVARDNHNNRGFDNRSSPNGSKNKKRVVREPGGDDGEGPRVLSVICTSSTLHGGKRKGGDDGNAGRMAGPMELEEKRRFDSVQSLEVLK